MKCDEARDVLPEVLYAEVEDPEVTYRFFRHLWECPACEREFEELVAVRRRLGEWAEYERSSAQQQLERRPLRVFAPRRRPRIGSWLVPVLQTAAAVVVAFALMLAAQQAGWIAAGTQSPEELQAAVQHTVVASQEEQLRMIGQALLDLKEEMLLRDRAVMEQVYGDLVLLEQRYRTVLEQNRQMQRLTSQ